MVKPTTVSEDVDNARRLEEHARNFIGANQVRPNVPGWFDRRLDAPTFVLAVIGAVVSIVVLSAFMYPLALASWKFWVGV